MAGDYQGLAGISQTITVPDTAVPVKLHVPIFLDIPVTGTLGTFTVHGFRFPEITGDIFLIGIPFNAATLDAFSFPNISIVLPNIGINLGSGPDPLIDIAGTGGLLPIKIPLIDIPAALDSGTRRPPRRRDSSTPVPVPCRALATWAAIVPASSTSPLEARESRASRTSAS